MKELFMVIAISLIFAYISELRSTAVIDQYSLKKYESKEKLFWCLAIITMALFCGLRIKGNDTWLYRGMFEKFVPGVYDIDWTALADAPGFRLYGIWLKTRGVSVQNYLMITSFFTIGTYLWFIRKYTSSLWLSMYYFIFMGVYDFTFAAIKQTMAVAFLLIAVDKIIRKKYVLFFVFILIAELFHPYAFVYLVVLFLFYTPWTKRTYIILALTVVVSLLFSQFLTGVLSMTESLGYQYSDEEFTRDGVNVFRVIVVWIPLILSFIVRKRMRGKLEQSDKLIINASMMNSVIMFIGLFGTANYFARLANYFLIFQAIALPKILQFLNKKIRVIVVMASVVMYPLFFYYGINVANGKFGDIYGFMSLAEYLKELI